MKIQIISEQFHKGGSLKTSGVIFGGQELLLRETCKVLISAGHEVEVLQFGERAEIIEFEGIRIKKIKCPNFRFFERMGFIRRWTWAGLIFLPHISKDADWIHLHNHHFSFPIVFFKKKNQIMTGMNHGVEWDLPWTYERINLKNIRDRFSFILLRAVSRFSVNKLDKIITNDRFFIHHITAFKPHLANKLKYIPNYFDERVFNLDFDENDDVQKVKSTINNFSKGRKIILLPKMVMKERGTDLMLTAIKDIKDAVLIITGVSSMQEHYVSLIKENDLENKVLLTGHIDYEKELIFFFHYSDIVVIPSPCREATAIALLEAMACKKPVIASEIGGLVEIIWHRHNGLLSHPNPSDFTKNINLLLSDDNLSKKLSNNAFRDVNERFSRKAWIEKMENFFK